MYFYFANSFLTLSMFSDILLCYYYMLCKTFYSQQTENLKIKPSRFSHSPSFQSTKHRIPYQGIAKKAITCVCGYLQKLETGVLYSK